MSQLASSLHSKHGTRHQQHFINDCLLFIQQNKAPGPLTTAKNEKKQSCQTTFCFDHLVPGAYLTAQENRCVEYLLKGYKYKAIAQAMNLSVRTVEFYFNNIKQKFLCKKKAELVSLFKNNG